MSDSITNEERIKRFARAAGFDAVRITTPEQPAHTSHVDAWLASGMNADMGWLETRAELRGGRLDDERLLGGAKSVVVLAASYERDLTPPAPLSHGERGGAQKRYRFAPEGERWARQNQRYYRAPPSPHGRGGWGVRSPAP